MNFKWLFVALLVLLAHFAASYLVPLDKAAQGTFGGLLRWAWPWADGDGGPLGRVTTSAGFPLAGFFIAVTAAGLLLLAALSVAGLWVPAGWWRPLVVAGAGLSVVLMALFFGPTKFLPIGLALVALYIALANAALLADA
ncbi:MAG TPA: hypothetical protein VFW96_27560 [Thermomicrobiales bacterium]|nr:hypothetical protein [Thermomicrobiales bacterium]